MSVFKATKKPVTIEAILFDGLSDENVDACEGFCDGNAKAMFDAKGGYCISIKTLEGSIVASKGDCIIKGVQGEFYPCKPDIFKATYNYRCKCGEDISFESIGCIYCKN